MRKPAVNETAFYLFPRRMHSMSDIIFWPGWGLSGSCPGAIPVMPGESKFAALFTVLGVVAGTYLYGLLRERARPVCGATLASAIRAK